MDEGRGSLKTHCPTWLGVMENQNGAKLGALQCLTFASRGRGGGGDGGGCLQGPRGEGHSLKVTRWGCFRPAFLLDPPLRLSDPFSYPDAHGVGWERESGTGRGLKASPSWTHHCCFLWRRQGLRTSPHPSPAGSHPVLEENSPLPRKPPPPAFILPTATR